MASFGVSGNVYTNITVLDPFTTLKSDIEALAEADLSSAASAKDSDEVVAVAEAAAAIVAGLDDDGKTAYKMATTTTADQTFENLQTGYYLIVEETHGESNAYLSTKYILVAVDDNETVAIKTSTASVTKKIVSEHDTTGETLVDADTVAIGDTVTYQLDAPIPDYDSDATSLTYTLTDTMSAGLTFTGITSVQVSKDGSQWTDATSPDTNAEEVGVANTAGATVTISLSKSDIITYSYVRVILTATLNSNASIGETGNPNSAKLEYTNNYYGGSGSYTTPWDTVITYTGELNILKVDSSDGTTGLKGATFKIRKTDDKDADALYFVKDATTGVYTYTTNSQAEGATTELVSDDSGVIKIAGLDVGTYYAFETAAPTGYSLASSSFTLTLSVSNTTLNLDTNGTADKETGLITTSTAGTEAGSTANSAVSGSSTYKVTWNTTSTNPQKIENTKGTTLPGTGGIGTTLFTFGGLALVILAAVMFIIYTKKQRKQA